MAGRKGAPTSLRGSRIPGFSVGAIFVLALIVLSTLFTGAWAVFEYYSAGARMRSSLESDLALAVDRLASSLALNLWNVDYQQADAIVVSAMGDRNVLSIEVTPAIPGHEARVFTRDAEWGAVKAAAPLVDARSLSASRAITERGVPVGTVRVVLTERFLEAELASTMYRLGWAVCVLDVLQIAALYALLRFLVLKPLRSLGSYAREVSGGRSAKLPPTPPGRELSAVLDSIGRMVGLLERRYLEAEASQRRFKVLFDHAPDGILELDGDTGRILGANGAAEALLGRRIADGRSSMEDFLAEAGGIELLRQGFFTASGGTTVEFEAKLRKGEGGEALCAASLTPLPDVGPRRPFRLSLVEVGEKRDLEARLRHAERLDAIGQLAGGVAHDFNNQLGGILGFAELLVDRLPEGKEREWAQGIMKSAMRASGLTRQLLAYARRGDFTREAVDLNGLCRETAELLDRSIDKRIRITLELGAERAVVMGDPSQLQNALLNLAINARDAMPEGGTLGFATRLVEGGEAERAEGLGEGPFLEVSVSDTGTGMDEETLKHLFEPFFTTKGPGKGTGLGLAAVYGTVRNHRGDVRVESGLGEGTRMSILLPLDEEDPPAEAAVPGAKVAAETGGTIILIDDEAAIRETGTRALEDLGYRVIACWDAESGIQAFSRSGGFADLVILDMILPGSSGREIFAAIRALDPGARVLIASGYSLDGEARALIESGAAGFIQKPFTKAQLAAAVRRAMAARKDPVSGS